MRPKPKASVILRGRKLRPWPRHTVLPSEGYASTYPSDRDEDEREHEHLGGSEAFGYPCGIQLDSILTLRCPIKALLPDHVLTIPVHSALCTSSLRDRQWPL